MISLDVSASMFNEYIIRRWFRPRSRQSQSFPRVAMTDDWATLIDVREMCTQLDRCVCVPLGRINHDLVSQLKKRGYDQAPVTGVRGIVATEHLETLVREDRPLEASDPEIRKASVHVSESLKDLLNAMSGESSVLVIADGLTERASLGF